jgi:hypothetical protein
MLRNFGISLLLFGLLLVGTDGFRIYQRSAAPTTSEVSTNPDNGSVHMSEGGMIPPPR